jgi:hypothetical protein
VRELPIARSKFRFSLLYGWARRAMRTVPCPIVSEWSLPGDYERIEPGFPQRRLIGIGAAVTHRPPSRPGEFRPSRSQSRP